MIESELVFNARHEARLADGITVVIEEILSGEEPEYRVKVLIKVGMTDVCLCYDDHICAFFNAKRLACMIIEAVRTDRKYRLCPEHVEGKESKDEKP